jgi:hypothetical protein
MTDTMRLRVAKAISRPEIWDAENLRRYGDLWIQSARDEAMEKARKAIEAMMEPTDEMVTAGLDNYEFGGRTEMHVLVDWQDMIREALK